MGQVCVELVHARVRALYSSSRCETAQDTMRSALSASSHSLG